MHLMSCPSIVFWKSSILKCPFVYQHRGCWHSDGEVPSGLITRGPTGLHWSHQVSLAVPWTPYRVDLCLEAPCTQLTRSLYTQDWILMPPPCWRCWRPCWWCWRPWRWSWRPYRSWRSPRCVGEALITHSVVIHALMVSWYPRRRSINQIGDVMMDLDW